MRLLLITATLILASCNSNPSNTSTRQVDQGVAAQIHEQNQRRLSEEEEAKKKHKNILEQPENRSE